MKKILKDALILFAITLVAGLGLGFVHEITLEPIAEAQHATTIATYKEVFPDATDFISEDQLTAKIDQCNTDAALNDFGSSVAINDVHRAVNDAGETLGYVVDSGAKGYGGIVYMSTGIDAEGKITGIGFLKMSETPGLGMKAKEDTFTNQFRGMSLSEKIQASKSPSSESEFQAVSGATYTSKAVEGAINAASYFLKNYIQ